MANQYPEQNKVLKLKIDHFKSQYAWSKDFSDREIGEILFSIDYVLNYGHGSSGHLAYTVIEKLFELLDV